MFSPEVALRVGEQYSSYGSGACSRGERAPGDRFPIELFGGPQDESGLEFARLISSIAGLENSGLGYLEPPNSLIGGISDEAVVLLSALALVVERESPCDRVEEV